MDRDLKIFVIYNKKQYSSITVRGALDEEFLDGKKRVFTILDNYDVDKWMDKMLSAHEVWLFGDCKYIPAAVIANSNGCDVWQMG